MSDIEAVINLNWSTVIIGIFVILFAIKAITVLFDWFTQRYGITTKAALDKDKYTKMINDNKMELMELKEGLAEETSNKKNKIDEVLNKQEEIINTLNKLCEADMKQEKDIADLHEKLDSMNKATIETLNDRITQRINYFFSRGYIPKDEIGNFQRQFETYQAIGGNHGLETLYDKCIQQLEVK